MKRKKILKFLLTAMLAVTVCLNLTGCGGKGKKRKYRLCLQLGRLY